MSVLLDSNVLVALVVEDHVHSSRAHAWFDTRTDSFATCPVTQGTLLRHLLREGVGVADARQTLAGLTTRDDHAFWPDDLGYLEVRLTGVVGHRQVTDAYLAALARAHGGRLLTVDRGLAALHSDVTDLLPT